MAARRALTWLVLAALLAAQALGTLHRVVHAGHASPVPAVASQTADSAASLEDLFPGHGGEGDCRIYDQLVQGGCLPVVPAAFLPAIAPAFLLQWSQGEVIARWAALFDARGPPSIR